MLEDIDKSINHLKAKVQEFTNTNKIISDLRQKENSISSELSFLKLKLEDLDKKELEIKNLENYRGIYFRDIINKYYYLKFFISNILGKFDSGKDKILVTIQPPSRTSFFLQILHES